MLPVAPLMIEHRLIERMIALLRQELARLGSGGEPDPAFIGTAVDFIRTYADRCHHGKEEDILFRDLATRELSPEHRQTMEELVAEHSRARGLVQRLVQVSQRAAEGEPEAAREMLEVLAALTDLYPAHIEKEDRRFFVPVMRYLSEAERAAMLEEMRDFDRQFVHRQYGALVDEQERLRTPL